MLSPSLLKFQSSIKSSHYNGKIVIMKNDGYLSHLLEISLVLCLNTQNHSC